MWNEKLKTIWLPTALIAVTLVVFPQAYDDDGRFDLSYFILLELIFIGVVGVMFFIYGRRDRSK